MKAAAAKLDSPIRVLLADDHRLFAEALEAILSGESNIEVVGRARNGSEALEIVKRERPDLLISDLRMTEMSGHQLQQELQTVAPDLPVVIITAFGTIESAVESMKLGARDFITKPFSNKELLLVVARALENLELRIRALEAENAALKRQMTNSHLGQAHDQLY